VVDRFGERVVGQHTIAGKIPEIETGRRHLSHDWTGRACFDTGRNGAKEELPVPGLVMMATGIQLTACRYQIGENVFRGWKMSRRLRPISSQRRSRRSESEKMKAT
jgi:hypothetical protein